MSDGKRENMISSYTTAFYDDQKGGSKRSAERIVPILVDLLQPRSAIDVGCGIGAWLATFRKFGVPIVKGIDGPWVGDQLEIKSSDFIPYDFSSAAAPFSVELPLEKFDVAICLEFLEHLRPGAARELVKFLCRVSEVVVASAAIPMQGGTHHVNEQWPDYWASMFREQGFVPCDALRHAVWNMTDVEPWYAQNTIIYFKGRIPDRVIEYARRTLFEAILEPRSIVHPAMYRRRAALSSHTGRALLAASWAKGISRLAEPFAKRSRQPRSSD